MHAKKKSTEKFTLEEYQNIKKKREKRLFHFQFFPLPVTITLLIPLIFFIIIVITYFVYIKTLPNQ